MSRTRGRRGFDPVTAADRAAEEAIRALIERHFPDHGIIGEEYGNDRPRREYVWVIDPIDGTQAFISGVPVWGTLIGATAPARRHAADGPAVYRRALFRGDGNGSSYRGPDGERGLPSRVARPLEMQFCLRHPPLIYADDRHEMTAVERQVRLFRYGTDCYAYALVAAGHVDLVIETALKPYDVGAIIPVIERAGGVITSWDGGRPELGGRIIAAGAARCTSRRWRCCRAPSEERRDKST